MSAVVSGTSFTISSGFVNASNGFNHSQELIVYVEGFDDVNFWYKCFKEHIPNIKVIPYGLSGKANGKGTIISAIKKGDIVLGSDLVVALDSDYDYLLNKNSDVFQHYCAFQTYSYAIENLIWHPEHLDEVCQEASNDTQYASKDMLKYGLVNWSQVVYPEFLRFLKNGAKDNGAFDSIMALLDYKNIRSSFSQVNFPVFNDFTFANDMKSKGLDDQNVHLFVRGHDFENRIDSICQNVIRDVNKKVIADIKKNQNGKARGQLIQTYINACCLPKQAAKNKNVKCSFSFPRIMVDIVLFKNEYRKNKAPVVFPTITAS